MVARTHLPHPEGALARARLAVRDAALRRLLTVRGREMQHRDDFPLHRKGRCVHALALSRGRRMNWINLRRSRFSRHASYGRHGQFTDSCRQPPMKLEMPPHHLDGRRLRCASLFEYRGGAGSGGDTARAAGGVHPVGAISTSSRRHSAELPRVHRHGHDRRTAAPSGRAGVPAAGRRLADHPERARSTTTGLRAAAGGDLCASPLSLLFGPLLLGRPMDLRAPVLHRRVDLLRRRFPPIPPRRWLPPF